MDFGDLINKYGKGVIDLDTGGVANEPVGFDRGRDIITGSIGAGFGGQRPGKNYVENLYNFAEATGRTGARNLSQLAAQSWASTPQAQLSFITPEQYQMGARYGNPLFDADGRTTGRYDVGDEYTKRAKKVSSAGFGRLIETLTA